MILIFDEVQTAAAAPEVVRVPALRRDAGIMTLARRSAAGRIGAVSRRPGGRQARARTHG